MKKVGLEPGVKESELWMVRVVSRESKLRRCGRSMNREVRDRGTGMRLTEITRKLIPDTRRGVPKGTISYT